ncbi:transcription factor 12 [Esox lucius]|uniref:BHLH domain-containing protein n=1 Tax=Esox lucius TaxID=8010 RepID=A0A3P8XGE2_ESOLU|nr:transcription factor 12 [Esox lucius]
MYCASYPVSAGTSSNNMMYCYNVKSVYAQSPNHDNINPDSSSHPSSRGPGGIYPGNFFAEQQQVPNSSPDMWNTSSNGINPPGYGGMVGGASAHLSGNYGNMQPSQNHMDYSSHSVSPDHVNRGLPPMSTFHRTNPAVSHTSANSPANSCQGNPSRGSQTGATLGKALASIYSPDHTSSSDSSCTPDRSPSPHARPPSGPPAGQWRSSGPALLSPSYESSLISLSQLEDRLDRLDDVIHVLRNHAVGPQPSLPRDLPSLPRDLPSLLNQASQGHGSPASLFGLTGLPPAMVDTANLNKNIQHHPASLQSRSQNQNGLPVPAGVPAGPGGLELKLEGLDREEQYNLHHSLHGQDHRPSHSSDSLRSDEESESRRTPGGSMASSIHEDEDNLSPEQKAERERERRMANNARERLRVRDINEAFKELGQMTQMHLKSEKPQTKLLVLHQAVAVILSLEQQVRERNLNPKAACLRRREQEKMSVGFTDSQGLQHHPGLEATHPMGQDL